ncbi:MAG: hypothetical protein ABSA47_05690 [Verrucomicrobiota bacterium]
MNTKIQEGQLVDGKTLLENLFPKNCRPCLRWLRNQQRSGKIPSTKIGRLVFFDPEEVRQAIFQKHQTPEQGK